MFTIVLEVSSFNPMLAFKSLDHAGQEELVTPPPNKPCDLFDYVHCTMAALSREGYR